MLLYTSSQELHYRVEKVLDKLHKNMYNNMCKCAGVAQSVEQLTCNQQVVGSIPIASSIFLEGFPSGQREQTVNLPSSTSKVRILLPPPFSSRGGAVGSSSGS